MTSGEARYTAEYGRDVCRGPVERPLEAIEDRKGVTITTGPIRVEFPRTGVYVPGIVSVLRADGSYRRITLMRRSPADILKRYSLVDA